MPQVDADVLAQPQRLAAARRARHVLPVLPMPLDAIARLATRVSGASMAVVAVMEVEEEHFVGSYGLPKPLAGGGPVPTSYSLCKYVVSVDHPVSVADMAADPELRDHDLLVEYGARAFAGVPLRDAADRTIGSLVVVDVVPREFTGSQIALLVEISTLLAGPTEAAVRPDGTAGDGLDGGSLFDGTRTAALTTTAATAAGTTAGSGTPGSGTPGSGTAGIRTGILWADRDADGQRGFLRALLDSLDVGVIAVDALGRPIVFNRAMRQLHQVPQSWTAALLDDAFAAHVCRPDGTSLPPAESATFRALHGEHVRDDEILIKVPGERTRILLVNAQPIVAADGEQLGAVAALHEITQRRRFERFRDCRTIVALALADAGTAELAAPTITRAVAAALGWPHVELRLADEVSDRLRLAGYHSTLGRELDGFVSRSMAKGSGISGRVWATARPLWVSEIADTIHLDATSQPNIDACTRAGLRTVLAVPIPDGDHAVGVLTCFADTAESDQAQLTTLLGGIADQIGQFLAGRRNERLTLEVARVKDDFLALIGHEMRTPLTSISSCTDMLLDDAGPELDVEETRQLIEGIARNTATLRTIVDDLLDLAAMESGYLRISPRVVDLAEIARQALRDAGPSADANGVAITAEIPTELVTTGDPQRLRQVLENLLSNAIKYSPDGGHLRLVLGSDDRVTTIVVADTGIGIPQAERHHLFHRFYRATNARHRGILGTGLGLTIVRAIVEAHHGTITLEDPATTGTTITVRLPARPVGGGAELRDPESAETE